jgi:hypothetical protein
MEGQMNTFGQVDLEVEKFKIQKTQMYLQIVSVMLSATLIYFLIKSKRSEDATNFVEESSGPEIDN